MSRVCAPTLPPTNIHPNHAPKGNQIIFPWLNISKFRWLPLSFKVVDFKVVDFRLRLTMLYVVWCMVINSTNKLNSKLSYSIELPTTKSATQQQQDRIIILVSLSPSLQLCTLYKLPIYTVTTRCIAILNYVVCAYYINRVDKKRKCFPHIIIWYLQVYDSIIVCVRCSYS